ncbi:predicted protein, partial [Postia placenta Mad-698-R]
PDPQSSKKSAKKDSEITKIREKHAQEKEAQSTARKTEIEKMEAEIRKLARRGGDESDDEPAKKKAKKSYLEEEMAKYAKGRGAHKKGKRRDESDVLAALNSFRSKIKGAAPDETEGADPDVEMVDGEQPEQKAPGEEDPGVEVDDDTDFLTHALHFPKDNNEEVEKAERDYEVIDPRQRDVQLLVRLPALRLVPQALQRPRRAAGEGAHPLPHGLCDLLARALGLDDGPRALAEDALAHLLADALERSAHARLHVRALVALVAEAAARAHGRGRHVEEEREVRRGQPGVRRAVPLVGERARGGVRALALAVGEGDPGEGVAVADDGGAGAQCGLDGGSVGR